MYEAWVHRDERLKAWTICFQRDSNFRTSARSDSKGGHFGMGRRRKKGSKSRWDVNNVNAVCGRELWVEMCMGSYDFRPDTLPAATKTSSLFDKKNCSAK